MNLPQALSTTRTLLAAASGIAVAVGWLAPAQAAPLVDAIVGALGAVGTAGIMLWGIWESSHARSIQKAAEAIRWDPTVATAAPVIEALRDARATVSTVAMIPINPAKL